ncbi:hypothetical protein BS47DRAFT_1482992 [Hydnum rufescens UP504]|uniref:Uncharacterized protein n=1 Tax=Hydnum rufescens UP504 TaxID=1448309 RepID=A0A9P6B5C3_9AGAM|nr:hypothetical protein BS47DRAFT_1482992 [Hydnum rufescens UP504]
MEAEEVEWRDAQAKIGRGEPNKEDNQGKDTYTEDDGEGDHLIPGCYSLDIGLYGLVNSIWIRTECWGRTPCAVITGQPGVGESSCIVVPSTLLQTVGIGKSVWFWYAARRRIASSEPFILFRKTVLHLFVKEGVYILPSDWTYDDFTYFIWTFVDTDHFANGSIPPGLVGSGTPLFVIRNIRHISGKGLGTLTQNYGRAQSYHHDSLVEERDSQNCPTATSRKFGPTKTPQCLEYYESTVNAAISGIDALLLEKIFSQAQTFQMSHEVCLVGREDHDDIYSGPVIDPITDWGPIATWTSGAESRTGGENPPVSAIFKAPTILEFFRMVKKPMNLSSDSKAQGSWPPARGAQVLDIRPDDCQEYADDELSSIIPNVMYVPQSTNEKVIDPFILVDGILYVFQFTIASKHEINHRLAKVGDKHGFPTVSPWRFVFIIPPNVTLTVPPLGGLDLYAAIVDPEDCYWF